MKELSVKEKAKCYEEVVNKLKRFMAQGVDPLITRADVQDFFPELKESKESEDERIRKELIFYFQKEIPQCSIQEHANKMKEFIAWLEKQGGHAKFINGIQVGDKVTRNEDGVLVNLSQLNRVAKKQGEQKSTIIIPKFRVGDEICWKGDTDNNDTIAEICDGYYLNQLGNRMDMSYTDTNFELVKHEIVNKKEWTINDAKNGGMLSYSADDGSVWLMIFQSEYKPYDGYLHYHVLLKDEVYIKGTCCLDVSNLRLSNEEERDLLFQKMKEAGYEWDAEKKELKKIEQNPADEVGNYDHKEVLQTIINEQKPAEWSEEDNDMLNRCISLMSYNDAAKEETDWLKSLKERVQPQLKQEWSEEDERMLDIILNDINYAQKNFSSSKLTPYIRKVDWLKSLKDRYTWKPSDKQMQALSNAGNSFRPFEEGHKILWSLYNDLKKLMEK